MTRKTIPALPRRRALSTLAVLGMMAASALPLSAQTAVPNESGPMMTPAEYASAALRQDMIQGAYEALEAPELGVLFVASTPGFDKAMSGFVDVLNAQDLSPIRRIRLARRAFALGMDHKAGKLYVGNTLDGSLSVIDAKSGIQIDTVQLGKADGEGFEHTRMIAVDEEGGRIYVSSPSETGTLWIVDSATGKQINRIDNAATWAAGLALDTKAKRLYVSGGGKNEILVVNTETGERVSTISTGDTTSDVKDESKHFFVNLALDAGRQQLYAADASTGQVYVIDIASGKVAATVPVGMGTLDVVFNDAQDQVYATYRGASREAPEGTGGVVIIDAKTNAVLRKLDLPTHPNSLELSDDGKTLYVTVKAPMEDSHPDFRTNATDSVLRFDLDALNKLIK